MRRSFQYVFRRATVAAVAHARCASSGSQAPPPPQSATPRSSSTIDGGAVKPLFSEHQNVDPETAEQMRIASEMGEEVFEENTKILKEIALRGARAMLVCAVGLLAFSLVMSKKRKQLALEAAGSSGAGESGGKSPENEEFEDPTQRYLEEMRGLGFDVDTLEEELEQERIANQKGGARKK